MRTEWELRGENVTARLSFGFLMELEPEHVTCLRVLDGEQRRLWLGRNFGTQRVHPPRPVADGDWPRLLESGCSTPAQRERPLGGAESSWVSVKPGDMVLARAQQQRWR